MKASKSQWVATDCTICYHSCGMRVLVEEGRITRVEGLKEHLLNKGRLCPKGERAAERVYHPDRLKYPLKKVNGQWKRMSWDDALGEIADKLQGLKKAFGPDVLSIFSGSIGVENLEMMEMAQRFKAHATEDLREGVVSIPHGWPREANVNLLTDVHCREPIMGYPQMKSQLCSVRKA